MAITRGAATVILIACVMTQPPLLALGADQVVLLRAGTPVFLIFDQSINGEAANEGDTISLRVLRPVLVDGAVLIRSGQNVRARLIEV
jgi:hypothetical protein